MQDGPFGDTARSPEGWRNLEGTPAALTDERLQALARGRVPDPTAKQHRTHTVRTPVAPKGPRAPQRHTPQLASPLPRPPTL